MKLTPQEPCTVEKQKDWVVAKGSNTEPKYKTPFIVFLMFKMSLEAVKMERFRMQKEEK